MNTKQIADMVDSNCASDMVRKLLINTLGNAAIDARRESLRLIRLDLVGRYTNGRNWRIDIVDSLYYANGGAEVGMGATIAGYSDRAAYTIVAVNATGTVLTLQADHAVLDASFKPDFQPGGFSGHVSNQNDQSYSYRPNPNATMLKVRLRKDGRFYAAGSKSPVTIGIRSAFYDYNF